MRRISGILVSLLVLLGGTLVLPGPTATAATAPTVHEVRVIGHTVKGRPIRAWRLGDPTSKVKVVFLATMHGDEAGPGKILLNLRDGAPIRGADIWVIPYLNRDGMARHARTNAHKVDLNRNYPVSWVRRTGHYNSGSRPASEPETVALMRFLNRVKPAYVVSMHQPLNGVDTSYQKGQPLAKRLATYLELPRKVFNCNSGCHGTMTQWYNARHRGVALTLEYGSRLSTRQITRTGPNGLLRAVFARR